MIKPTVLLNPTFDIKKKSRFGIDRDFSVLIYTGVPLPIFSSMRVIVASLLFLGLI